MKLELSAEDAAAVDLVLVRHGRPVLRSGVPAHEWRLDRDGAAACTALGVELGRVLSGAGRHVSRIFASSEPKAVETAVAIQSSLGLPGVERHAGLVEHRRGVVPIMGDLEWHETVKTLFERPSELVFGQETADQARSRFAAALSEVMAGGDDGITVVVSHGTVMTLLLAEPNGIEPMQLWGSLRLPDALFVRYEDLEVRGRAWPGTP